MKMGKFSPENREMPSNDGLVEQEGSKGKLMFLS